MMRVLGVGNPFRHDDGVGSFVANILGLETKLDVHSVRGDLSSVLNQLEGVDHLIVVDAVEGKNKAGKWIKLQYGIDPIPTEWSQSSTHGLGLAEALEMAKIFGSLPKKVTIYGVYGENFFPGEGLALKVETAAREIILEIQKEK